QAHRPSRLTIVTIGYGCSLSARVTAGDFRREVGICPAWVSRVPHRRFPLMPRPLGVLLLFAMSCTGVVSTSTDDTQTVDEELRRRCGDGHCGSRETCSTCPADCGACGTCGDGTCNGPEDCTNCAADCGACSPVSSCGDGACAPSESCSTCA